MTASPLARVALILAFSCQGGRDLLVAIRGLISSGCSRLAGGFPLSAWVGAFVGIGIYGIIGFSGFFLRVSASGKAVVHIRVGRTVVMWVGRVCQNQDLRDYRIFSILHASVIRERRARVGRKRNPENPQNPINPDSDKCAQPAPSGADTLTLALSHQGRGGFLVEIRAWFR